jgi:hypothetical protein
MLPLHYSGFEPRAFTWFSLSAQKGCGAKCGVELQLLAEIERRPTCADRELRYSFFDGIREAMRLELP